MAIDFPASPSVNDIHTSGGKRWTWNGTSWERSGTPGPGDTISATNDNTTSTLYPVLVTGTGSNTAKIATTSSKSVSFNASNGNLTATTFTGTLNTAAQTNITSVGTLGSLNVTGDVSVGGVLTYEDVKNVDSVGIITARSGIRVPDGGRDSNEAHIRIGDDGDFRMYHEAGAHTTLENHSSSSDLILMTSSAARDIIFKTNGNNERLRIASGGDVGIGTDNPSQPLHISRSNPVIRLTDTDTSLSAQINATNGNLYFDTTNSNRDVIFRGGSTEVARITGDGKLGIGSAIPSNQLDVVGGSDVFGIYRSDYTGTGGAGLSLYFGGAKANGDLFNCASITAIRGDNTAQAGELRFNVLTSGTMSEKLRIKSNGYVGINSTGAYPLDVFEPTDNAGWISISGANTGYDTGYLIRNGTTPKWYLLNDVNGSGGHTFEIRGDGNNSDRFFTLTQAGKFGFNDASPERTIDVKGSNCMIQLEGTGGNGRQYSLCSSDDTTGTAVDGGPSGTFAIYDDTAGAARLRITPAGLVGINCTPNKELEVRGTDVAFRLLSTVATGRIGMEFYDTSAQKGYFGYPSSSNDEMSIQQNEAADLWFYVNGGERLRIKSTGQVRIDGPTAANHGLRFTPNGWNSYDNRMGYCGTSGADFWWSSNWNPTDGARDHSGYATNYIRQNITTGYLSFGTGAVNASASERLRITSDGKVLIGPGNTYNPQGLLHIVGDDNSNGPELYLQVNNNNTTDNIGALWFGNNVDKSLVKLAGHTHTANNTADFTVSTSNAGTLGEKLRVDYRGNMGLGTNSPNHYNNYSTITLNGATGGEIDFEDDGTLLGDHFCNVNGHYFTAGRSAAMPFIWQTHNGSSVSQRMQLTSTGQLNIGGSLTQTTFQAQITGDLLLQKAAAAYDNPLLELYATNNTAHGGSIKFTAMYGSKYELARIKSWGGNGSPGSSGGSLTIHTGDGTEKIRIQADGNINFGVNEPVIRVDSSNSSNSSALRVEIDGTEQFRFDPSSITYKDATNSARGTLIGPLNYHLDTNGYVNFSQWYLGTDWNVLEVFGYINPNSAGSGAYTDPLHMYIYRGIGWDQANNVTAHWIYSVHVAPPARQVFPSGSGMSGNSGISAVWYHPSRGIVGNKSSNGADYIRLVIPNANQSYNYQKNFRILRRY